MSYTQTHTIECVTDEHTVNLSTYIVSLEAYPNHNGFLPNPNPISIQTLTLNPSFNPRTKRLFVGTKFESQVGKWLWPQDVINESTHMHTHAHIWSHKDLFFGCLEEINVYNHLEEL